MKKLISMLLAGAMVLSLAACGGGNGGSGGNGSSGNGGGAGGPGSSGGAGDMKIAMITDSGDITDQSFNQTTYETAKAWSEANGSSFTYYKPESDSDEARSACVDLAAADGANIILMPGYMFARALVDQTEMYPDIKFIALDMAAGDILGAALGADYDYHPENWTVGDYYNTDNTYCAVYQEEISGFMAGYAAVKLGYRHLGFLGGMSVPAVQRFGYGYIQGIDKAAAELGVTDEVTVEYVYGGLFYGTPDFTAAMDTWYNTLGVEVVFACGGGIYTSAAEAAAKVGGKVIGVDSDQAATIDAYSGVEGMTVTSAMKGLDATVNMVLTAIKDGKWSDFAGKIENLGMISDDPSVNYVQLPRASTQWSDGFTEDDYLELVKQINSGSVTISNDVTMSPDKVVSGVTVNDYGSIMG